MDESGQRLISYPSRAANVIARMEILFPLEALEKAKRIQLDAADVLFSAGTKCGSTWVQQIMHGLRSGGNMDFEDVDDVFPHLCLVADAFAEASAAQLYKPNMFKTHAVCEKCPDANRVVVLTRNPTDAALSKYHFFRGWVFEEEELNLDEFVDLFYTEDCSDVKADSVNAYQMQHLASWYPHRMDDNVLWLHFEDLKSDLPKCIRLLAEFLQFDVRDQKLLDLVEHQASIDFMKKHEQKFDSNHFKVEMNESAGLVKEAGTVRSKTAGKIRNGNINESRSAFSDAALKKLNSKWKQLLKPVTSFDSYEEMRASINAELGRSFGK